LNQIEFWASDNISSWGCSGAYDLQNSPLPLPGSLLSSFRSPAQSSVYDLASLTKVLCTGALIVRWAEQQKLSVSELASRKIVHWIPELKNSALKNVLIGELWEHRSGLVANCSLSDDRDSFFTLSQRDELYSKILSIVQESHVFSAKKETVYSDVGFILLTLVLERSSRKTLDILWKELKEFLGLEKERLDFAINNVPVQDALPTETRHESGVVNDNKAFAMGGVAPHAGLFGDMKALQAWVRSVYIWAESSTQAHDWLIQDCRQQRSAESSRFSWGWDTASGAKDSHAGPSAPKSTRGHLGYTGNALWLDPLSQKTAILLSNRVYPSHTLNSQKSIHTLRTWFFESFWQGTLVDEWEI